MDRFSKIYVAGHKGLVGSAILRCLEMKGYKNLLFRTQEELDLANQLAVERFFADEKPDYVLLAAAKVGGIMANNTFRADFIYQNLMIQSNVIVASWKYKVKKLLFLGSTCIYPRDAPQPLKEEYLLTSPLEYTNEPYAIAKIAGLKMCEAFNLQYKTNFISVMPTNLYGPGDNYNLEESHVLPAIMRKIHLAMCIETGNYDAIRKDLNKYPVGNINGNSPIEKILNQLVNYGVRILGKIPNKDRDDDVNYIQDYPVKVAVNVWGTGNPLREFMFSSDLAEACVFIMENTDINDIIDMKAQGHPPYYNLPHFLNIGTGEEISIRELALKIKRIIGFNGDIIFDTSKPDGTMRKATDISLLKRLGYTHKFNLDSGLVETYAGYLKQFSS